MAANVDISQLDGWYKERYADKQADQLSSWGILSKDWKFKTQPKLGDSYHFPVVLQREHGVTFDSTKTAFTLNAPLAGLTKDASENGTSYLIRSRIAYDACAQASSSKEAFGRVFDYVVKNMVDSSVLYKEMCLLYGQTNLAGSGSLTITHTATTAGRITVAASQWAPGIWSQMEGGKVDIEKGTTRTSITITSVDLSARQLYFSGVASGSVASTSELILIGQGTTTSPNVFPGIDKITTNTGTLYGINAATYGAWKSNTKSYSGSLTMKKFSQLCSDVASRSSLGPRRVYTSHYNWADLNDDHAALRRFNSSTKGGLDLGTERIVYYGPTGMLEIVQHPMIKVSEAFVVDPRHIKRLGSTDLTFDLPGSEGHNRRFLRELPDNAGFEIRAYWNQFLCADRPNAHGKISGLVPTAFAS